MASSTMPPAATPALRRIDPFASLGAGWTGFSQRPGESIGVTLIAILASAASKVPLLGWIVALLIVPAVYGGIYSFCLRQIRGENPPFEAAFSGFRRWWAFAVAQFLLTIIVLVAFTPTGIAIGMAGLWAIIADYNNYSGAHWPQFLAIIPVLFVNGLFVLWLCLRLGFNVICLADDPACGPFEALGRSWRTTRGNTWRVLALAILFVVVLCAGAIALVIGLLVAIPIVLFAFAHAYDQIRTNARA